MVFQLRAPCQFFSVYTPEAYYYKFLTESLSWFNRSTTEVFRTLYSLQRISSLVLSAVWLRIGTSLFRIHWRRGHSMAVSICAHFPRAFTWFLAFTPLHATKPSKRTLKYHSMWWKNPFSGWGQSFPPGQYHSMQTIQ